MSVWTCLWTDSCSAPPCSPRSPSPPWSSPTSSGRTGGRNEHRRRQEAGEVSIGRIHDGAEDHQRLLRRDRGYIDILQGRPLPRYDLGDGGLHPVQARRGRVRHQAHRHGEGQQAGGPRHGTQDKGPGGRPQGVSRTDRRCTRRVPFRGGGPPEDRHRPGGGPRSREDEGVHRHGLGGHRPDDGHLPGRLLRREGY